MESDESVPIQLTKENLDQQEDSELEGESADVFADVGSDGYPWRREESSARVPSDDIAELNRSVYETFSEREQLLQSSYANTRYFMTETYLDTELSRYELLMKEMRDNSVLKSVEEIDIRLQNTDFDNTSVNLETLRDHRISEIKITWLLKTLKASEDFHLKSNLVRSMFRRTNSFFNELNDMEFNFLTKKHIREVAKQKMLQKLRNQREGVANDRIDGIEISNQKEIQSMEIRNLKELYVRMLQKENGGLDHHLDMLEKLYNTLHKIYIDVMNLKIKGVKDWYDFKLRHDLHIRDSIRHIKDKCVAEFNSFRDRERTEDLNAVKANAEEEKEKRQRVFGGSDVVLSSELVFKMTMTKSKNMYYLEDASSVGALELEDDEGGLQENIKNTEYVQLMRTRISKKKALETKYNDVITREIEEHKRLERAHIELARKTEVDFLKNAMRRYFKLETELEDRIQEFLIYEKNAIDALKARQKSEMDSVIHSQEIELEKWKTTESKRDIVISKVKPKVNKDEMMITAHVFHEIRNVLASILCLGENLKEDPNAIESIVEEQSDICTYALDTMNDMLSIAKIKSKDYKLNVHSVCVSELFDLIIRIQGKRAAKEVQVIKLMEKDFYVLTDKKLLLQLFVNLLSNAAKFTTKGTIALCAHYTPKNVGTSVRLGILDTGIGTKKLRSDKSLSIVNGFIETHSEISSDLSDYKSSGYKVRNTGYGLYLASTVAESMGSKLKVLSPVPANLMLPTLEDFPGSFFYLNQPEAEGKEESKDDASNATSSTTSGNKKWVFNPTGKCRFLVVDDQRLLRQTMVLTLKSLAEKYTDWILEIDTSCCAEEALRKHREANYDVISLDTYYDSVLISKIPCSSENPPPLTFSADATENTKAYIYFKEHETFNINRSDGVLLGTDVIDAMRKEPSKPIVFSCTGSDDVTGYILKKPYTSDNIVKLFEANMTSFLQDKSLELRGDSIIKNENLVLFKMM